MVVGVAGGGGADSLLLLFVYLLNVSPQNNIQCMVDAQQITETQLIFSKYLLKDSSVDYTAMVALGCRRNSKSCFGTARTV